MSSSVIVKLEKFSFPTEFDGNEERIFTFQFLFVEFVYVTVAFTLGGALETKTSRLKSIYDFYNGDLKKLLHVCFMIICGKVMCTYLSNVEYQDLCATKNLSKIKNIEEQKQSLKHLCNIVVSCFLSAYIVCTHSF